MALRWTWRWELRHLLELCGFVVEAEYSDFARSGPAYGKELIVVAGIPADANHCHTMRTGSDQRGQRNAAL